MENIFLIGLPDKITIGNIKNRMKYDEESFHKSMGCEKVVFDFSRCAILDPTGLTYILIWRDSLVEKNIKVFYRGLGKKLERFVKSSGIIELSDDEKNFKKYSNMVEFRRCYNSKMCKEKQKEIFKVLERAKFSDKTIICIDYVIGELIDNAAVHGYEYYDTIDYEKPVYIGAYVYTDRVEVCVGDRGQGIYESLKKNNDVYKKKTSEETLRAAIMNGVTGHPYKSAGYGLYSAAETARQARASLNLISSKCILNITDDTQEMVEKTSFNTGTLAVFTVYKNADLNYEFITNDTFEEYKENMYGGIFDD